MKGRIWQSKDWRCVDSSMLQPALTRMVCRKKEERCYCLCRHMRPQLLHCSGLLLDFCPALTRVDPHIVSRRCQEHAHLLLTDAM